MPLHYSRPNEARERDPKLSVQATLYGKIVSVAIGVTQAMRVARAVKPLLQGPAWLAACSGRLFGLVARFSLRAREVPGPNSRNSPVGGAAPLRLNTNVPRNMQHIGSRSHRYFCELHCIPIQYNWLQPGGSPGPQATTGFSAAAAPRASVKRALV